VSALVLDEVAVLGPQGRIVAPASLRVSPGVPLVILGETGSGKSLLAQAIMGTLPAGLVATGAIRLGVTELPAHDTAGRRAVWGREIAMLPQEPWAALDPTMQAHRQVAEVPHFLACLPWRQARRRAAEALAAVGLAPAERRYPFQLSGGMCQRVALAATRIANATLLLADEPTKGLDTALRDSVAALLAAEVDRGAALVVITHDIALARALGGEMAVMLEGDIVEQGATARVLAAPEHAYTRRLIAAEPEAWVPWPRRAAGPPVVEGRGLAKSYGAQRLFEGMDLALGAGETVALLGPSGTGKSTLGNILLGLVRPDSGSVRRRGDLPALGLQKLYQDPLAAFAPSMTLGDAIAAVIRRHRLDPALATRLGERLRLPVALLARRPDQVSGGELQRFALLRALLLDPALLFADEPTSRLDLVTQAEVMELLREVVADTGMALLLVTHDAVMAGKVAQRNVVLRSAGAVPQA
jgi:peptide/nickel transport system ATP-binding protein